MFYHPLRCQLVVASARFTGPLAQSAAGPKLPELSRYGPEAGAAQQAGFGRTPDYQANAVLRFVRASLISKEKESRTKLDGLSRLAADQAYEELRTIQDSTVWVYYYDYSFIQFEQENNSYVMGFRPVLIDKERLLIQGFLINTVVLIQESQSYLENLQTDFGSVVLEKSTQVVGQALFEPFSGLRITYKTNEDKGYLRNYYDDQRRFYITMVCLTIALAFSMIHMGTLIYGHVDLSRKKNNFISRSPTSSRHP